MEEVFPTYDLSGHRITTTLTHHRMLTEGCSIAFLKPDCEGSCSSCSGKKAKENCKRKKTSCKGSALDGLSFPFLTDLASIVGLLAGEDIEIIDFKPPEMTFSFEKDIPITVWTPPNINIVLGFGFSATLEIALVLDSKGIREAVQEKKPIKALNSFAIRDIIDDVDTPLIVITGSVRPYELLTLGT
eukprot:scaffold10249_cov59-Cyclotella_meneghiniana.AAC.2